MTTTTSGSGSGSGRFTRGQDPLENNPEERLKRLHRHRHNGFTGDVARMRVCLANMLDYPTTTDQTRELASGILEFVRELAESLRHRREGT